MSKPEFGALIGIIDQYNSLSQPKIESVANQAAMLALDVEIGFIAIRADDNNYQYLLKALPATSLSNWEVLGKDSPPLGEDVLDIITTNEVITSKVDGLYAFAGVPLTGFPAGIAQGDIGLKDGGNWTVAFTFATAPATIFSLSDFKTYVKTVNGAGLNTWQSKTEPSVYEHGPDKKYAAMQAALDAIEADFRSGKIKVGIVRTDASEINESLMLGATADIQNVMIEGYGVQGSANVQITKLTLGPFSHRIKLKNILFTNTVNSAPLVIQSAGTCTENGVPNVGRGKHFLDNVSLSTPNATSLDVQSCENFLVFNNCDFGGTTKIVNIANKTGAATTVSIDGCNNGLLNIGNNRIVTKNNSASVYRGTISASALLLDIDTATPIAYSILRSYTALGATVPVALGAMIINDDVGGGLHMLKCKTAYTIAGNVGLGTAIDLTKYDIESSRVAAIYGAYEIFSNFALPTSGYLRQGTGPHLSATYPALAAVMPAVPNTIGITGQGAAPSVAAKTGSNTMVVFNANNYGYTTNGGNSWTTVIHSEVVSYCGDSNQNFAFFPTYGGNPLGVLIDLNNPATFFKRNLNDTSGFACTAAGTAAFLVTSSAANQGNIVQRSIDNFATRANITLPANFLTSDGSALIRGNYQTNTVLAVRPQISSSIIARSTNAGNSAVANGAATFSQVNLPTAQSIAAIATNGTGKWLLAPKSGSDGFYSNDDGVTWTQFTSPSATTFNIAGWDGVRFVMMSAGGTSFWYSTTGETGSWINKPFGANTVFGNSDRCNPARMSDNSLWIPTTAFHTLVNTNLTGTSFNIPAVTEPTGGQLLVSTTGSGGS
jgi:hypothetical protein